MSQPNCLLLRQIEPLVDRLECLSGRLAAFQSSQKMNAQMRFYRTKLIEFLLQKLH